MSVALVFPYWSLASAVSTALFLPAAAAYGFLFAGMAMVGSYVALSKPLAAAIPLLFLATLRFGIAAVAMLPWTYVIFGKRLTASLSAMRISPLINMFGLVLVLPFGLWQLRGFDLGGITSGMWALLGYCAIAASVLSTWLWLTGHKHVPAHHTGVFTVARPFTSTLIAVAVLNETLTTAHLIACTVDGIVLIARGRQG